MDKCVIMTQKGPYKWDLIAPKGHVLVEGLTFQNARKASEWCELYISSFNCWTFKLKRLENYGK